MEPTASKAAWKEGQVGHSDGNHFVLNGSDDFALALDLIGHFGTVEAVGENVHPVSQQLRHSPRATDARNEVFQMAREATALDADRAEMVSTMPV